MNIGRIAANIIIVMSMLYGIISREFTMAIKIMILSIAFRSLMDDWGPTYNQINIIMPPDKKSSQQIIEGLKKYKNENVESENPNS